MRKRMVERYMEEIESGGEPRKEIIKYVKYMVKIIQLNRLTEEENNDMEKSS